MYNVRHFINRILSFHSLGNKLNARRQNEVRSMEGEMVDGVKSEKCDINVVPW